MYDNFVNIVAYYLWGIQSVPGSVSRDKGCSAGGESDSSSCDTKQKEKTNYEKEKVIFFEFLIFLLVLILK